MAAVLSERRILFRKNDDGPGPPPVKTRTPAAADSF